MKRCSSCKTEKALECFCKHSGNKDGLSYECRECTKKRKKLWNEKNKQYVLEYNKKYRSMWTEEQKQKKKESDKKWKENNAGLVRLYKKKYKINNKEKISELDKKRQKTKKSVSFKILPKEINRIVNSPCVICGSFDNIHIDHIIPIALGGNHSIGNIQPLCAYHNLRKGKMLMKEYMVKLLKEEQNA